MIIERHLTILIILLLSSLHALCQYSLTTKGGSTITYDSIIINDDTITLFTRNGKIQLPKNALSQQDYSKLFEKHANPSPSAVLNQSPQSSPSAASPSPSVSANPHPQPSPSVASSPSSAPVNQNPLSIEVFKCETNISGEEADFLKSLSLATNRILSKKYTAKEITFDVKKVNDPTIYKVHALIPYDSLGKIPRSASNIVFYAPFMGYSSNVFNVQHRKDTGTLLLNKCLFDYAEVYGMIIYTIEFSDGVSSVDDHKKCYYYPESRSFQLVFDARNKLIEDNYLSKSKLLIFGYSGGGSMAEHLAISYPSEIGAIAMIGGDRFDPITKKFDIPWCILHTRDDVRKDENLALVQELRDFKMNVLYAETEPLIEAKADFLNRYDPAGLHHGSCELGFLLCQQFLVDVAQQAKIMDTSFGSKWPYMASAKEPFVITKNDNSTIKCEYMYFPSEEFVNLWKTIPYRNMSFVSTHGDKQFKVILRYPKFSDPQGIVILSAGSSILASDIGDLLDYIALKGYIGITAFFGDEEVLELAETKSLLQWICSCADFKKYSLCLAGFETGGRHLLLSSASISDKRSINAFAFNSPLDWPFPFLSPIDQLPSMSVPIYILKNNGKSSLDENMFYDKAKILNKSIFWKNVVSANMDLIHWDAIDILIGVVKYDDYYCYPLETASKRPESALQVNTARMKVQ